MNSFCPIGDIRKKETCSSEDIAVLASENLLLQFRPPLGQVLELKEIIVGIVSVFRKINYG